jgi:hypothetical protein
MIQATSGKLHWNYFLALERDLEVIARYVEFTPQNYEVYSIELAHLLLAAASEVDVVANLLCSHLDPTARRNNIDDYGKVLLSSLTELKSTQVFISRYGLTLTPWENWSEQNNPEWWRSYNKVKHERDTHFNRATLKNGLNAMAALLILTTQLYRWLLPTSGAMPLGMLETTHELKPETTLMRLGEDNYYVNFLARQ